MGGSAFSSHPPFNHTPRMPIPLYTQTRNSILSLLRTHFAAASCPVEAPAKRDHGDIDFMVLTHGPKAPEGDDDEENKQEGGLNVGERVKGVVVREEERSKQRIDEKFPNAEEEEPIHQAGAAAAVPSGKGAVKKARKAELAASATASAVPGFDVHFVKELLGAEFYLCPPGSGGAHFAVLWPETDPSSPFISSEVAEAGKNGEGEGDRRKKYIQIDITPFSPPDPPSSLPDSPYTYAIFYHSHGDLWAILASLLRPLGLTPTPTGLCLRIPDLESVDKKRARIFLSRDPKAILAFLCLSEETYQQGWAEESDYERVFGFVGTCRFWDFERRKKKEVEIGSGSETAVLEKNNIEESAKEEEQEKEKGKSAQKDKRVDVRCEDLVRAPGRAMLNTFLSKYLPAHTLSVLFSREQVKELAFESFGQQQNVREEYEERLTTWKREVGEREVWERIKAVGRGEGGLVPKTRGGEEVQEGQMSSEGLRIGEDRGREDNMEGEGGGKGKLKGELREEEQPQIGDGTRLVKAIKALVGLTTGPPNSPFSSPSQTTSTTTTTTFGTNGSSSPSQSILPLNKIHEIQRLYSAGDFDGLVDVIRKIRGVLVAEVRARDDAKFREKLRERMVRLEGLGGGGEAR